MAKRTDPGSVATQLPAKVRKVKPTEGELTRAGVGPAGVEMELGATGTENMLGIITGEEYLPALVPPDGLRVYEQMRNFAQVAASLWIVKAPILSSTPIVRPPKDGDSVDQAIADFCQLAMFEPGLGRGSWRREFEHLMTRLDFGVSVSEKVWRYDLESGTWRLQKLAPRMARTIWEWKQNGTSKDLETVVQQALHPDGSWKQVAIPASKCVVSSFQREGDNYWGRSLLRSAYFHWFAIMELLKIGLVRADRWGVGIPKAKFTSTEGWHNKTLVNQVKKALKALRSHDRAWVLEHPEVEFSMVAMNGTDGGVKLADDVAFHEKMIIQNVLASFLSSQSDGMSTNRTSKLADVFSSVLELCAGDIAEDLDQQVIRELCDFNFVMTGREYPHVEFTNIADTDLEALSNQVGRLYAIGGLTPQDTDEEFFRDLYKLPPREERPAGEDRRKTAGQGIREQADDEDADDDAALRLRDDDERALLGRAPTSLEVFLLRDPESYARGLNATAKTLAGRLAAIREQQLKALMAAIAKRDARTSTTAFTDIRPDHFTIPEKALTKRALRDAQKEAFADGRRRVRQELGRQGAAVTLRLTSAREEWDILQLAGADQPTLPITTSAAKSALTTSAVVTAERLNDLWFNRILEVAVRLRRGGVRGQSLVTAVWDVLATELTAGLRGTAKAEVNEAFGLGRGVEAQLNADEIEKCVWSCLLDVNSCDPCAKRDGIETTFGSEEYLENPVPWKGCDGNKGGGDACRCQWLFLMKGRTV